MALRAKQSATLELPPATLQASVQPSSWNPEDSTFVVALYTGASVQRFDWRREEVYELVLDVTPEAVDLSFLKSGRAPFLLDHSTWNVRSAVAGVFVDAWIENGTLMGRIRASKREEFAGVYRDVADGILRNVSVGADILSSRWEERGEGERTRKLRATRWKPHEGSLVAIGADENAAILSRETRTVSCLLLNPDPDMDETNLTNSDGAAPETQTPNTPATSTAAALSAAQATEAAISLERSRVLEIQRVGAKLGVSKTEIEKLVRSGATLDASRAKLIELAASADAATSTNSQVQVLRDERDGQRAAIEAYLAHRTNPRTKLEDQAKRFVGLSLLELGRECLEARGIPHKGRSKMEVAQLALHSTSDFPEILANVAAKNLRAAYMLYPSNWRDWTRTVPASDFKEISSVSLGDSPKLLKVGESAEFKRGKLTESAEKYRVETYGRVLGITRQAIVNDDLGALSRVPELMGAAAGALVADLVFGILNTNAALSDGVALFHATHANLGDKTLTVAGMNQARAAMRTQTGPNGHILNVAPAFVLVPAALETSAQQLLVAEIVPVQTSGANPFRGAARVVVDARLDASSTIVWYAVADPSVMDTIQVSFLEGQDSGPMIESRVGFDVDGVEIKVRMDVGAKAVEHRGMFKSAGTTA